MGHTSAVEWSIQEIARAAGTTSRTLRYYGEIGLLPPSRVGDNGYRFYDERAVVRLQRILLLRELGLGIPEITRVLAGEQEPEAALTLHLELLEHEKERIARLIATVESTLRKLNGGEQLMPKDVFDGFDHTEYREEVIERWGKDAYENGDRWWNSLTDEQKQAHQRTQVEIASDFAAALKDGKSADSDAVQAITRRHVEWLSQTVAPSKGYLIGLGEMYVADPRFAANYEKHGIGTAEFVRDAIAVFAQRSYA
jgi:DNA-binding transcriptional MerR regulator